MACRIRPILAPLAQNQEPEKEARVVTPGEIAMHRDKLAHVFWIGGPPDGGKTSVAGLVAEAMNGVPYHQDRHEMEHLPRADPARYPMNAGLWKRVKDLSEADLFENLWLGQSPADGALSARLTWEERLGLICEDLLALPMDRPIVAEGPGFFPHAIQSLIPAASHAIWLVPTETFKRASRARRNKSAWRTMTSDPDRACRNHIERDLIMAEMYRDELVAGEFPWIEIDATDDVGTVANQVAHHFQATQE
jgi:hypothetical protein